jgi:D-amino peptidase
MKIFFSVDMEGATGVCHRDHLLPGGHDYEAARRWLTGDVNAAIEGALSAGATEVLVADGHGTMRNILLDALHPAARLLTGPAQARNRPLCQLGALGPNAYDMAFFVGYHARAGHDGGLLAHTWVGALVQEIRLNGRPASEAYLNAAILGYYGIPVVLATGADDFCREAREDLGADLQLVEVKQTLGPSAVVTLSLERAHAAISDAAARAVKKGGQPLLVEAPVTIDVFFHRDAMRAQALELGGEAEGRLGIRYTGETIIDVAEAAWRGLAHATREESAWLQ